jgi:hypothetical protein
MSNLPIELKAFREIRRAHGIRRNKNVHDHLDGLLSSAADRIEELEALLTELVDIEGPKWKYY